MSETLLSVGLDVGTTTTQLIVSELTVCNQASAFAVPKMQITERKLRYQSPVYFTPLQDAARVDADAIRKLVDAEYRSAGIARSQVNTGAIIITGETARKENAAAVLHAVSDYAGDFVVATAGPDLESLLAAKGSGAVRYSEETGKTVLHMDIGGGTSNLALIENGTVTAAGCLNVGGRLIKRDKNGTLTYVSPVLRELTELRVGDTPTQAQLRALARTLTQALEMAAGKVPRTELYEKLCTQEASRMPPVPPDAVVSFSGGVAECIGKSLPDNAFGDMGTELGRAISESTLCRGAYRIGDLAIRATVIGAGCHSTQLSGSTVFLSGVSLPVQNLPVAVFTRQEQESDALCDIIAERVRALDAPNAVLAFPGYGAPAYPQVVRLADKIAAACKNAPVYVCTEADMAKALGQCLLLRLPKQTPCLCLDRVALTQGSYLDVGNPVGPALPVVVKTLILSH